MTATVLYKLLAIFCTVALGWAAGRLRWLGPAGTGSDPSRTLGNAAFYIFVPALLFRTTARLDLATLPWATLLAFFAPVVGVMLAAYGLRRWQLRHTVAADLAEGEALAAEPAARAVAVVFGNSVQVGIPVAAAVFGEAGLGIHIAVVSLHAMVLLTALTVLVELDIARARAQHEATAGLWRTVRTTVRNTLIHPVVLPVLAGMAWHTLGIALPAPVDETLQLLGQAVAPLCLVLIGLSLAYLKPGGLRGAAGAATRISLAKLLALPAAVLAVSHGLFGLSGLPLQVVVLMAAMPTGSNALIFAQRYRSHEAVSTTAIVFSTLGFVLTAPLWLAVLARVG
jgi:predicted permease